MLLAAPVLERRSAYTLHFMGWHRPVVARGSRDHSMCKAQVLSIELSLSSFWLVERSSTLDKAIYVDIVELCEGALDVLST